MSNTFILILLALSFIGGGFIGTLLGISIENPDSDLFLKKEYKRKK